MNWSGLQASGSSRKTEIFNIKKALNRRLRELFLACSVLCDTYINKSIEQNWAQIAIN